MFTFTVSEFYRARVGGMNSVIRGRQPLFRTLERVFAYLEGQFWRFNRRMPPITL